MYYTCIVLIKPLKIKIMSKFKNSWELFKQDNPTSTTKSIRVVENKDKAIFTTKINNKLCCVTLLIDRYIIEDISKGVSFKAFDLLFIK